MPKKGKQASRKKNKSTENKQSKTDKALIQLLDLINIAESLHAASNEDFESCKEPVIKHLKKAY